MEIKGIVISGMGEGSYFMSQKIYQDQFQEKLGFIPFIGTLNLEIDGDELAKIRRIPKDEFGIIKGKGVFGDVRFIKTTLKEQIEGALIFPEKTKQKVDVIEFISAENVREALKLEDGDLVTISVVDLIKGNCF
jgi:riboflavin kinase, archaea type